MLFTFYAVYKGCNLFVHDNRRYRQAEYIVRNLDELELQTQISPDIRQKIEQFVTRRDIFKTVKIKKCFLIILILFIQKHDQLEITKLRMSCTAVKSSNCILSAGVIKMNMYINYFISIVFSVLVQPDTLDAFQLPKIRLLSFCCFFSFTYLSFICHKFQSIASVTIFKFHHHLVVILFYLFVLCNICN